jgi:cytidine deaminase
MSESTTASLSDSARRELIDCARRVREKAYAPYSHYLVGAALLDANGTIHMGCNVENAAYGETICAERSALVRAISDGVQKFTTIAVVTKNGGYPCGSCRQMLYEFAPHLTVIIANADGNVIGEQPLHQLLPGGFGPEQLDNDVNESSH